MINRVVPKQAFLTFIHYLLAFFLLVQWIEPLSQLTQTSNYNVFIFFIEFTFFLYFIKLPHWIRAAAKIVYIFTVLHALYYQGAIVEWGWLRQFTIHLWKNTGLLFSDKWIYLSNEYRSFLFFILLWLIVYLIRYWILVRQNIWLFFIITLLYISVLDTFTRYNGSYTIVRAMIAGLLLSGLLLFQRVREEGLSLMDRARWLKWCIPLFIFIGAASLFGYEMPKAKALLPDPVPFLQSALNKGQAKGAGAGALNTALRENDSKLGGPFKGDNRVVFQAKVDSDQYWKVETKDIYTGKGWVSSDVKQKTLYSTGERITELQSPKKEAASSSQHDAFLTFQYPMPYVVYPYGVQSISSGMPNEFSLDSGTEKLSPYQDESAHSTILQYGLSFWTPEFQKKELISTTKEQVKVNPLYLELPDSLPKRVEDLALNLTKGKTNWYDKAAAIEDYLQSERFTYDKKHVAIPGSNQDYVDQFLFETKKGYCDNFSTSMVVLLRAAGVPSRWVKGYAPGSYQDALTDGEKIYQVTNNDAHSWPEVWFPKDGWIPFEPTKGFAGQAIIHDDLQASTDKSISKIQQDEQQKQALMQKRSQVQDTSKALQKEKVHENGKSISSFVKAHKVLLSFCFLLAVLAAAVLYLKRGRWMPVVLVWSFRRKRGPDTFPKAYLVLLKQLDRFGIKRKPDQTLRDYAHYIDSFFNTDLMLHLTAQYEKYLYRGALLEKDWEESRELWENLIRKTAG